MLKYGIVGGGAWGTAFGAFAARCGNDVVIWDRDARLLDEINDGRHPVFAGVALPEGIVVSPDFGFLEKCDIIVIAIPFQAVRSFLQSHFTASLGAKPMLLLSKGIEVDSGALGHQIIHEVLGRAVVAVLSGPNFASEVVRALPAATVIACADAELLGVIGSSLGGGGMRVYKSVDVVGVEICAAVKNVIAIAAGICIGAGYGENARAALIARSLNEVVALVRGAGGLDETVYGLAGIGDLILTATSPTSRNFSFGVRVGESGRFESDMNAEGKPTIEGIATAKAIMTMAGVMGLEMPVVEEVYNILYNGRRVEESLRSLMGRR